MRNERRSAFRFYAIMGLVCLAVGVFLLDHHGKVDIWALSISTGLVFFFMATIEYIEMRYWATKEYLTAWREDDKCKKRK